MSSGCALRRLRRRRKEKVAKKEEVLASTSSAATMLLVTKRLADVCALQAQTATQTTWQRAALRRKTT